MGPHLKYLIHQLVDPSCGIISQLRTVIPLDDRPGLYFWEAQLANLAAIGNEAIRPITGGADMQNEMAMLKAIAEAVERYAAACIPNSELVDGSWHSLGAEGPSPGDYALYSAQQFEQTDFPFVPFTENTPLRWTQVEDAFDQTKHLVPAGMIYLPYQTSTAIGEAWITQPISTGLAAHIDIESASLNALMEVVERDAISLIWQARMKMPLVVQEELPGHLKEMIVQYEQIGYRVTLLDGTLDASIPTMVAVLEGNGQGTFPILLGAGTHLDPLVAVRKCLQEPTIMEGSMRSFSRKRQSQQSIMRVDEVLSFADHLAWWSDPRNVKHAGFLTEGKQRSLPSQWSEEWGERSSKALLSEAVLRLNQTGFQTLIKDITPPDIRSAGMVVVRALVPGYHNIASGHHLRRLGGDRLWQLPAQFGQVAIHRQAGDNPYPCPFV